MDQSGSQSVVEYQSVDEVSDLAKKKQNSFTAIFYVLTNVVIDVLGPQSDTNEINYCYFIVFSCALRGRFPNAH